MSDYTEKFQTNEEISLEEFAWICARGYPAFISQRNEPLESPPILVEEVSEELQLNYEEAQEAWRNWTTLSQEGKRKHLEAKHASYAVVREADLAENNRIREKCEAMIRKVTDWEVPEEYTELQEFMLYHLEAAMWSKVKKIRPVAPLDLSTEEALATYAKYEAEYLGSRLTDAKWKLEEEEIRVQKCNEWKKGLVAIFNPIL